MSDLKREPEIHITREETCPVVFVDGAYCGMENDVCRLLFYEDQVFPKFDSTTPPANANFDDTKRRISFEVRIPTTTLLSLCYSILTCAKITGEAQSKLGQKEGLTGWVVGGHTLKTENWYPQKINNPTKGDKKDGATR